MALRLTAALRDSLLGYQDLKHAMSNCVLKLYSGAQPATAETAPSGTLLCTYTDTSGTPTREVLSSGTMTLTGGSSGSVSGVTVNSIDILGGTVNFNTSLTQTAADVVTQINRNPKNQLFRASSAGAIITIKAKPGLGATPNTWTVAGTLTTITATYVAMASGVDAVNCLNWDYPPASGVLSKTSTQTWSGVAASAGTAGWFRIEASVTDAGGTDGTETIFRVDGAVATSGAELNMASTSISSGVTQTISSFALTLPTS